MATKTHVYSAKIQYDADGVAPYTDLSDMMSFKPPNVQVGTAETTHLESTSAAREFIPGWIDGGEIAMTMYFAKAQFSTVYGLLRTSYYWRMMLPLLSTESNNSRVDAYGHITLSDWNEITIDGEVVIQCPFTIKVSGKPSFTQGS